jgi:hypothetical protein
VLLLRPQDEVVAQLEEWPRLPPTVLDEMVVAAQAHLRRHFTFDALAAYVMEELRRLPSGR